MEKEGCSCNRSFVPPEDLSPLEDIVERYRGERGALISVFHEIQQTYGYLDEGIMGELAKKLGYQLSHLYGLATFYTQFRLKPIGKHLIRICHGTACHVRNVREVTEEAKRFLNIVPGETTEDMYFTLETVNCLGTCAIAPVLVVDGVYHGHMTPSKMKKLLEKMVKEGGREASGQD